MVKVLRNCSFNQWRERVLWNWYLLFLFRSSFFSLLFCLYFRSVNIARQTNTLVVGVWTFNLLWMRKIMSWDILLVMRTVSPSRPEKVWTLSLKHLCFGFGLCYQSPTFFIKRTRYFIQTNGRSKSKAIKNRRCLVDAIYLYEHIFIIVFSIEFFWCYLEFYFWKRSLSRMRNRGYLEMSAM